MWAENFLYIQALCFVLKNNQVSATENQSLAVWPPEINLALTDLRLRPEYLRFGGKDGCATAEK